MNISDLIEELEEMKEKYGDIDVFVPYEGDEHKLTIPDLKHSSQFSDHRFETFELEKGCRCMSCMEWQERRQALDPFILIDIDWL